MQIKANYLFLKFKPYVLVRISDTSFYNVSKDCCILTVLFKTLLVNYLKKLLQKFLEVGLITRVFLGDKLYYDVSNKLKNYK